MLVSQFLTVIFGISVIHIMYTVFAAKPKKETNSKKNAYDCEKPQPCIELGRDYHLSDLEDFQHQFCFTSQTYSCVANYAKNCLSTPEANNMLNTLVEKKRLSMCTKGPYTPKNLDHVKCLRNAKPYYSYACLYKASHHGLAAPFTTKEIRYKYYVQCMGNVVEHICGSYTKQFIIDYLDPSALINMPEFEEPDERSLKIIKQQQAILGPEYTVVVRYNNNDNKKKK